MFYKPGQARTSSFNFGENVAAWEGTQPGIVFASNDKENTYEEVGTTVHGIDSNVTEFQAGVGAQIKSKRRDREWDNGVTTTSHSNISPPRRKRRLNNHNDLNLMSQGPKKASVSMTEICTKSGPVMRRTNEYKSKINIVDKDDHTICSITPPLSGQKPAGSQSSLCLRELQKQILSEELQILLHKVTHIIKFSLDLSEVSKTLYGIQTLRGIQELVPFLSRFVATGLRSKRNLLNTSLCRRLVQLVDAMLGNPNLDLELHIHQILTPLGTCVVAKRLSYLPNDNHWSLRDEAAQCISKICRV